MSDDRRTQMAYFRYGVISSLLPGHEGKNLKERLRELGDRLWTLPDGRVVQFSWQTIEGWYYDYRAGGMGALTSNVRKDCGTYPGIPEGICATVDKLLRDHPRLKTSNIIRRLRHEGLLGPAGPSNSTLYRYARTRRPGLNAASKERRSFEAPYAGSLWQVDFMYGPFLPCKGPDGRYRKKQTFLLAVIDDHSRLLCHGQFYFRQDLLTYVDALRTACRKRGVPERVYSDNGAVFRSPQVKRIIAELGSTTPHTAVGDAPPRGKIERLFKNVQDSLLNYLLELAPPSNIDELNRQFWRWMEQDYNHAVHSELGCTPMERWLASAYKVRLLSAEAEDTAFLFHATRKVSKDGTIRLNGRRLETDWTLAGKKVELRYDPFGSDRVLVYFQGQCFGAAHTLDRQINATLPRHRKESQR